MARPTAESLAALRQNLPPFLQAKAISPEMLEFCQFYGIDFEQRLPGVEHRVGTVPSGDFSLVMHSYLQADATSNLLLVHGYFDHSGLFGHLIEFGLKYGCNVLIFDLPGHGLSTGKPAAIDDFKQYGQAIHNVMEAATLPALPQWALAQSTGCSALMEFSRAYDWPFVATVFLAPLIRPKGWLAVRLAYLLLYRFVDGTKRQFSENSSDKAFLSFIREDPLQSKQVSIAWVGALRNWLKDLPLRDLEMSPVLVLQGDLDETVAWRRNMKDIIALAPGCRITYLEGAGHQLANESKGIRSAYIKHIEHFLGSRSPRLQK